MAVSDADTAHNGTDGATMGVETFTVIDNSQAGWWWSEANLDIDWQLTSEHTDVTVTVTNLDTGQTVAEYSGLSGSETYTDYDAYGDQFEIKIEAGSLTGGSLCKRYVGPADGTDNFELEDCSSDGGEPDITTTSASVAASEITAGESVDVTAELTNDGDAEGTHTAELTVDGSVVATKDVTLAAGESTTITFTETFDSAGTYALAVDGVDAGTVTVTEQADVSIDSFEVTDNSTGGLISSATLDIDWSVAGQGIDDTSVTVTNLNREKAVGNYSGVSGAETFSSNVGYESAFVIELQATAGDQTVCEQLVGRADGTDDFERRGCTSGTPDITQTDSSLSASEVTPGESVNASATFTNNGDAFGQFEVNVTADGETIETQLVDLLPGESETVSTSTSFEQEGTYTIAVDGETIGTVTVEGSGNSDLEITTFSVTDRSRTGLIGEAQFETEWVVSGEQIEDVTVTVENFDTGEVVDEYSGVSGERNYTNNVQAGDLFVVTLTATASDGQEACEKLYGKANGDSFERSDCTVQPDTEIVNATLEETELEPGDRGGASITVTNNGDAPANYTATLTADGEPVATENFGVLPGDTVSETVNYDIETPGTYTMAVNGETAGEVTVVGSGGSINVTSVSAPSRDFNVSEPIPVNVTLENNGPATGSKELTLSTRDKQLLQRSVSVAAGETKTVTLTTQLEQLGRTSLFLNDDFADSVQVLGPPVQVREKYELVPDKKDSIKVTLTYNLTGITGEFVGRDSFIDEDATVLSTDGFDLDGKKYVWDGDTERPSITARVPMGEDVNEKVGLFGDIYYIEKTHPVEVVDRSGSPDLFEYTRGKGKSTLFLGEYERFTTTTEKETFELIVPEYLVGSDKIEVKPDDMLTIWERMSSEFDVNAHKDKITVLVSPTVGRASAQWKLIELDSNDEVDTVVHEYVHIRQDFVTEQSALWLTEATATFYGGQFSFRYGDMKYERYSSYYSGDPVNLTDPDKYDTDGDNYAHGSDVINALDSKIRQETDNEKSFDDVFRRLNAEFDDGGLTHEKFKQVVEDVAGTQLDAFFAKYVPGKQTPPDDSNPDKYEFTEVETVSGTLSESAATTGFVGTGDPIQIRLAKDDSTEAVRSSFSSTTTPSADGSWSLDILTGLADPIFEPPTSISDQNVVYTQYSDDQQFPRDGVPDVALLGSTDGTTDSLPSDSHVVNVTTVDENGNPLGDIATYLTKTANEREITVSDLTGPAGVFAPGVAPGLEFTGQYELKLKTDNFLKQRVNADLTAERDENVQVVYHDETTNDVTLQGTVVPAENVAPSEQTTISVLYSTDDFIIGDDKTRTVPVYVDGQQVKTVEIVADSTAGADEISLSIDETGSHTVRVGDLPGQTIVVGNSDDDGSEGDDYEPNLVNFEVIDQSYSGWYSDQAEFDISWEVTHEGNALQDVEVTVTNLDQSITRETYTGASGSQTYYDAGGYYNSEYNDQFRIRIEAVDDNGDTICQEYVGPADGSSANLQRQSCSTSLSQSSADTTGHSDDGNTDDSDADATAESVSAVHLAGAVA